MLQTWKRLGGHMRPPSRLVSYSGLEPWLEQQLQAELNAALSSAAEHGISQADV